MVAAVMQILLIITDDGISSVSVTAVRNVCNATLSLLFTTSLFIWGLLVNRKQAWRRDGGTAIFGYAALSLALISTALNFLYVHKEDEFVWLPGLMWSVVLWQSFIGWWWWVGAGSGSSFATEEECRTEKLRREAKRASRKREARERRKEKKIKAQKIWQDVTAVFAPNTAQIRSRAPHTSSPMQAACASNEPHTEPWCESSKQPLSHFQSNKFVASDPHLPASSKSTSGSVVSQSSFTSVLSYPRALPGVIYRWYLSLRRAHVTAARRQTAERVQRVQHLDRQVDQRNQWGRGLEWRNKLRVFAFVEANEMAGTITKSECKDEQDSQMVGDWRTRKFDMGGVTRADGESENGSDEKTRNHQKSRTDHDCQYPGPNHRLEPDVPLPPPVAAVRPSSMWWWGPLRRWRLQDSTVY